MAINQRLIRPERYSGTKNVVLNLWHLYANPKLTLNLIQQVPTETRTVTLFQFQRVDGVKINYFGVVQDGATATAGVANLEGYPSITDFARIFNYFIDNKVIDPHSDITIASLVQVQLNRNHFNTLLIAPTSAANHLVAYFIEPRSSNMTRQLIDYPIGAVTKSLSAHINFDRIYNLFVAEQPLLDDETCGAHQVNFTEAIVQLTNQQILNPEYLIHVLQQSGLKRRYYDHQVEQMVRAWAGEYQQKDESPATTMTSTTSTSSASSLEEDELLNEFELTFVAPDSDQAAPAAFITIDLLADPVFSQMMQANIKQVIATTFADVINQLITAIDSNYLAKYSVNTANLFSPHARLVTLKGIKSILEDMQTALTINDTVLKQAMHTMLSIILYSYYATIDSPSSAIVPPLEQALAKLLNCESEYSKLSDASFLNMTRYPKLLQLFTQRLGLELNDANLITKQDFTHYLAEVKAAMKRVNEIDSQMAKKLPPAEMHARGVERDDLLARMQNMIKSDTIALAFKQR